MICDIASLERQALEVERLKRRIRDRMEQEDDPASWLVDLCLDSGIHLSLIEEFFLEDEDYVEF